MDSLTQLVLGASVGEAVLGKKIGNKAVLWGAIGGTIPDLDVFLGPLYDPITSIEVHRGFSHSILFWILVSPLFAILVGRIHKKLEPKFKDWTWFFFLCFSTHALLDACTTWGTKLFWPFEYKVAFNNIFVADPVYTLPFVVLLVWLMFKKKDDPKREKLNRWALYITSGYMAMTFVFKSYAHYNFSKALESNNINYTELDTKPTPLNTMLWYAFVDADNVFYTSYFSLFDTQEISFSKPINKNHDLLKEIENQEVIKQLQRISGRWFYIEEDPNNANTLFYYDMRFGQFGLEDDAPFLWKYEIEIDNNGMAITKRVDFDPSEDIAGVFGELMDRMQGN